MFPLTKKGSQDFVLIVLVLLIHSRELVFWCRNDCLEPPIYDMSQYMRQPSYKTRPVEDFKLNCARGLVFGASRIKKRSADSLKLGNSTDTAGLLCSGP